MQVSYISTTAGEDGLHFDRRLPSIFDEIAQIKTSEFKPIAKEKKEFEVGDIPEQLTPVSYLLEAC